MESKLIEAAESQFGTVIEAQNNIFLIQREKGLAFAPLDRYMVIEGMLVAGNPLFHDGDYDLSLASAAKHFAQRANLTQQLEQIDAEQKALINQNKEEVLDNFVTFLNTYLDDEVSEGAALSDLTSSDNLDKVMAAFLAEEKSEAA